MDSREQVKAEQRRGGLLSRLRPGEPGPPSPVEPLLKIVRGYNPKADLKEIQRAYAVAEVSHDGQKRISGEDFILHPVAVATILADLHLDTTTITAALLHDTVEDTDVTLAEIEEDFGEEVARIVDGLTKLERIEFKTREQEQAENVRKMVVAMAGDIRVLLIKLADRLHNMRTLSVLAPEKQRRIATETLEIYAPLANRLGVQEMKWELEDLSFKTLHPGPYREIANLVEARRGERKALIDSVIAALRGKLKELGLKAEVEGRPEAPLFHLREDGDPRQGVQRDLRPRGRADPGRQPPRHVRRARCGAFAVAPGPRQVQGLHRHAQVEHVPVAAHDGRGAGRQAARDPDPHARHAPHRAVRHRCALALQGERQAGARRRRPGLARSDDGVAEGHGRPSRVHGGVEDRPLRRPGLRVHAAGATS